MLTDKETTISILREEVNKFVEERDWNKYHKPKELAISISIEASELLERFQWLNETEVENSLIIPDKLTKIKDELADVLIYCFSMANALNVDISQIVNDKISKNEIKYPVHLIKGKYKKYNE